MKQGKRDRKTNSRAAEQGMEREGEREKGESDYAEAGPALARERTAAPPPHPHPIEKSCHSYLLVSCPYKKKKRHQQQLFSRISTSLNKELLDDIQTKKKKQ
jgi:hypothetical protein